MTVWLMSGGIVCLLVLVVTIALWGIGQLLGWWP